MNISSYKEISHVYIYIYIYIYVYVYCPGGGKRLNLTYASF